VDDATQKNREQSRRRRRRETVDEKKKARRAADMRACRKRQRNGVALFYVATDRTTFDMMERFAGLDPDKAGDRNAVQAALGRLLRAGLEALLEAQKKR
jgi:hypothetical protein